MNFLSHSTSIIGDSSTALHYAQNDKSTIFLQAQIMLLFPSTQQAVLEIPR